MSDRITERDLQELLISINNTSKTRVYQLDYAYGGVKLVEITGGHRDVSHDGFGTKRQLHHFMTAFLEGMELMAECKVK